MTFKLLPEGVALLLLALASFLAEAIFYGGVIAVGVLQESFFLPLSFILGAFGVIAEAIGLFVRSRT